MKPAASAAGCVLIIAYIFPPLGGSGVYRTAKFVKYLPQFGWRPLVVCGSDPEPFATGVDPSLLAEIPPKVTVVRFPHVSARGPRRLVKRWLAQPAAPASAVRAASGSPALVHSQTSPGRAGRAVRTINRLLAPVEFPPIDDALYWALRIVPPCLRLIRQHEVQVILTTSFPYTDHLAGLLLHRLTGLPWVADFRDPWSQNAAVQLTGWRHQVDVRTERQVLRTATRIVGVTPSYTAGLHVLVPQRSLDHFVTIENGYDEDDFGHDAVATPPDRDGGVVLAHVGHIYPGTAIPFFELMLHQVGLLPGLRLRLVGDLPAPEAAWLANHSTAGWLETRRRCAHGEAIMEMSAANVLLLLLADNCGWYGNYPGKLFEYLRAGRPILLVGPDGDAARLLAASGTGCRLPLERPAEAVSMLSQLVADPDGFRQRWFRPDPQVVAGYERRALTARLAALLDQVTVNRGAGG